ncbi:MAG: phosphoribosylformylglycinamidine [Erysipelotrichaceae bacterium]|nr:MAG: phosphoribosylformylglycinamidine [Erysipelotrichaceae bacterium]
MSQHYTNAGVNLEAGYESVRRIKNHTERTRNLGMMSNIGSFGGLFDLSLYNIKEPVLVSGTDGVGTKLKIAFMMNKHDTVGIDAVAMCVNDILAQGALPLYFLDYIAIGKNKPEVVEALVKGVADGCVLAGCALIGGETAEMPDMYQYGEYDIAGFSVGIAEKSQLISTENVKVGQVVIGLSSSGIHSNGFSLVRKILFKDNHVSLDEPFEGSTIGETILTPTKIYVKAVMAVLKEIKVSGIAHITGGGFIENMPRCLQDTQGLLITKGSWTIPPIFKKLQDLGKINESEMYNIFNMGIGMILLVDQKDLEQTLSILSTHGENAQVIGEVTNIPGIQFV